MTGSNGLVKLLNTVLNVSGMAVEYGQIIARYAFIPSLIAVGMAITKPTPSLIQIFVPTA
eukprot:maker-scaffold_6-snap-gene-3.46-mRNA-1 protein AED:0.00 eAED:0.00 QI:118/1/1/1/1/1/2/930/59